MSDTLQSLGHLAGATRFRRISEKLYQDGDKVYQDAGLSFKASWFPVFYTLARAEGPLTVLGITEQIDFTHITVKNVLRELEKAKLVTILPNPDDGRSKLSQLSPQGHKLLEQLQPLWQQFTRSVKEVYDEGHPDLLNILNRVDEAVQRVPMDARVKAPAQPALHILDYRPSFKQHFYDLAAPWLQQMLGGKLEEEDEHTLSHPEEAYIKTGGFLFFAQLDSQVVGCVVLKRLSEHAFEFAKLFVKPEHRQHGIATKLIQRCITRCMENAATELWLQTTHAIPEAHQLYSKLGFVDRPAPPQMAVLKRTQKIMCMVLS